jgi:hypothetical protein
MLRGGISFGASGSVSGKGLKSLGFETVASTLHHEIWDHGRHYAQQMRWELTPLLSTTGFLMLIQHGPMIFRLRTSISNALVVVPIILTMFGLQALLGMGFSIIGRRSELQNHGHRKTD